jgi:dihydropyrimidine dehydrogenase (NAD+) subunit PreA
MSKKDLSIEFCGFKCINPFFLAASPVARSGDMIGRAFEKYLGLV